MLSSVLRSEQAIEVNVQIMRTFVRIRRLIESHDKLAEQVFDLEQRHAQKFQIVFDAIKELTKDKPIPRKSRTVTHITSRAQVMSQISKFTQCEGM